MMNFVRAQIKKAADETETILETTPAGKSDGEGALRAFIKRQGQKLRRLSNLFGCRDPEYVSPERSRSATPSDPASGQSHGDHLEDEDVGVVTQEVADDDMTLGTYQVRSAYMLKPRRESTSTHLKTSPKEAKGRSAPRGWRLWMTIWMTMSMTWRNRSRSGSVFLFLGRSRS
ncbi:uncharacterized protein LOC125535164 [Triticum urartu]|uniref:uncharacterized protein LOC125535164 n=1 Tax=Triticum urartu TaxID=4572 RepID=UPI0020437377|nr:uncharacterized protein LOC125535164 [Triticum urartu]